ncbi:hypothetical protein BT63DRAFT_426772 [Microthyrium microscopicum]|uniref:Acyltransferase 3 domain-containing protein n=1 Tax=Microthyrium microscopicum TaxID=703497 RepID=A0A6A6U9D6_9PEZI|nr:hypothetical protein BT63DRAFT_426772 [Microthyrium microscopicum]
MSNYLSLSSKSASRGALSRNLQSTLLFLLPSFIQKRIRKSDNVRKLHKTSFLDGVRGLAALFVFFYHTVMSDARWLMPAYGRSEINFFTQLPIFRLIYSGPGMVHIFFVISGYVLSIKHVRLVRQGNFEKLSETLFSSIFRRPFRLFIPCIVGLVYLEWTVIIGIHPGLGRGLWNRLTLLVHLWRWDEMDYNLKFLWTIPIEMAGSLLLFLLILGLSRAKTQVRMLALVILFYHSLCAGKWGPAEFIGGIFIAEVEAALEEDELDEMSTKRSWSPQLSEGLKSLNTCFWTCALVAGLYLAGWSTIDTPDVPVLGQLYPYTPAIYLTHGNWDVPLCFWFVFSSMLIIESLFRVPIFQRPFLAEPIQYLGDISYSLYIMHGCFPMLWRERIAYHTRLFFGATGTGWPRNIAAILAEIAIMGIFNIWISDLFMRVVDNKSVEFARFMEKICRRRKAP